MRDYALVILNGNSSVATPLRYTTKDIKGRKLTAMGYPTNYFGGERRMFVNGSVTSRLGKWIMYGNNMVLGASGGAWVLEDRVTVAGVGPFIVTPAKEMVYSGSPVFDEEFDKLYQYALTLL